MALIAAAYFGSKWMRSIFILGSSFLLVYSGFNYIVRKIAFGGWELNSSLGKGDYIAGVGISMALVGVSIELLQVMLSPIYIIAAFVLVVILLAFFLAQKAISRVVVDS